MRSFRVLAVVCLVAACGPKNEFGHQTAEAYASNEQLRNDVLKKCADHINSKTEFATSDDTDECKKAWQGQLSVNWAKHEARERAGWARFSGGK